MTVFRGTQAYATAPLSDAAITIGNFDGVHRGHRHLIDAARESATQTVVLTFDPAPRDVLAPNHDVVRIQTLDDRIRCLKEAGVDAVVVEPFTMELASMEPRDFAEQILRDRLRPTALVLGYDFRYGRKRGGTVDMLLDWLTIPIQQVAALTDTVGPVSSSRIREAVSRADLSTATELLGRPHELVGKIEHGEARGRQLGFPTANFVPRTALLPPHGVYAIRALVDNTWHPGVANWGRRPTWAVGSPLFEAHLLDFSADLYGNEMRVQLIAHLRPEAKFDGPDALKVAIQSDVAAARALL